MGDVIACALGADGSERARADAGRPRTMQTLTRLVIATTIASIVFAALPEIDKAVAGYFFTPGLGFQFSQDASLKWLRWLGRTGPSLALGLVVVILIVRVVRRRAWTQLSDAGIAYILGVFAIAPLAMSNLLLKANWGRPRPSQTNLFSGNLDFTPAWRMEGECAWNCSFVSGEASMSMALIAFAFVAPKAWRPAAIAAVCAWTAVVSANRMAFGAHYLSDVVLAAAMTAIVALALKAMLLDASPPAVRAAPGRSAMKAA